MITDTQLELVNLRFEDIDEIWNIYLTNHSYRDENLEGMEPGRLILNDETTLTYNEFVDLLSNKRTMLVGVIEKRLYRGLDNFSDEMLTDDSNILIPVILGFLIFEVLKEKNRRVYSILYLETSQKSEQVYKMLLDFFAEKQGETLRMEVLDGQYDVMKQLMINGFKKKEMVAARNNQADIFIFEKGLHTLNPAEN